MKKIKKIFAATEKHIGNGNYVQSPLPNQWLEQISPFLMLDHFGPALVNKNNPFYVPPHPHKGFEPVTLLFKGEVLHRDSLGNTGYLKSGDVQWMTAGSGIVHSEAVPPDFLEKGGEVELIQLWVNLPRAAKNHPPRYQDIRSDQFPIVKIGDGSFKVIAGSYNGHASPIDILTPVMILHGRLDAGNRAQVDIPGNFATAIYTLSGILAMDGYEIPARQLIWLSDDAGAAELSALDDCEFVILSGEPIREPVASYGPFVMNSKTELIHALEEYRAGKMGVLEE